MAISCGAAMITLGGCGAVVDTDERSASASSAGLPSDVVEGGGLIIATGNNTVPTHFIGEDGELVGFNVDIADQLSERLGVEVKLQQVPFDSVLPGIAAGRYDTALYNTDDNEERQREVDFVDYARSGSVIVTARGSSSGITTDPLTLCGRKVGLTAGLAEFARLQDEFSPACAEAGEPEIDLTTLKDDSAVRQALATGRIEALVDGLTATPYMVSQNEDKFELVGTLPDEGADPLGMPFAKGRPELVEAVEKAWTEMLADGEYERLAKKWELDRLVPEEITVNQGKGLSEEDAG